ncbi:MAG TPA: transcriptional regulator, partial [Burkholderiaceae bacterium]
MSGPTSIQIINGADGKPAFVVIPYEQYRAGPETPLAAIPHQVVERMVLQGMTPTRAWREHL